MDQNSDATERLLGQNVSTKNVLVMRPMWIEKIALILMLILIILVLVLIKWGITPTRQIQDDVQVILKAVCPGHPEVAECSD